MSNYYQDHLSSSRLQKCYEIAPARIRQYLEAEIELILQKTTEKSNVLELGCGYGRVVARLAEKSGKVIGIDISEESIALASQYCQQYENCEFRLMNALDLKFDDNTFDLVICIQNGISAFAVDPERMLAEAVRVTKKHGSILFSSYSSQIWPERLHWFQLQADHGLIGKIDPERTGNGVICCEDGFRATTFSAPEFRSLASRFDLITTIYEVDNSSLFCEMTVK